jgi:putative endonuclease
MAIARMRAARGIAQPLRGVKTRRMERVPTVYMLASRRLGTLYTGVTTNLPQRVHDHRTGRFGGFTDRHHVHRLVWWTGFLTIPEAIVHEKRVKRWRRSWKIALIEAANPDWRDLDPNFPIDRQRAMVPLVGMVPIEGLFRNPEIP